MVIAASSINEPITSKDSNDHKEIIQCLTLEQLFIWSLKELYFTQDSFVSLLKEIEATAITPELKETFEDYQYQAQKHLIRLEKVFRIIQTQPEQKKCNGAEGIINKVQRMIRTCHEKSVILDMALIIATQQLLHYQTACHNGLIEMSMTMKEQKITDLLEKNFFEEERSIDYLRKIAKYSINFDILRQA
ncbi:TPA: ferritin-like domain-containing protein [Elizabethkingia anophelis]